ncbi:hypothetical protein MMC17_003960 [Xylographa soralifera]|nr:hypothetical protein [Xylographa soralifera]
MRFSTALLVALSGFAAWASAYEVGDGLLGRDFEANFDLYARDLDIEALLRRTPAREVNHGLSRKSVSALILPAAVALPFLEPSEWTNADICSISSVFTTVIAQEGFDALLAIALGRCGDIPWLALPRHTTRM